MSAMLKLSPQIVLQATYGLQYYPTVNVTQSAFDPRARIFCIDSGADYSTNACEADFESSRKLTKRSRIERACFISSSE